MYVLDREMVRQGWNFMDMLEKQGFFFSSEERKVLLHFALHQTEKTVVEDAICLVAANNEGNGRFNGDGVKTLEQFRIQEPDKLVEQIVEYIVQIEIANICQEQVNHTLEKILKEKDVSYLLEQMIEELKKEQEKERTKEQKNENGRWKI